MKFEVNIMKKHFWMMLTIGMVLMIGVVVYAFGTNDPTKFGHSAEEIQIKVDNQPYNLQQGIDVIAARLPNGAGTPPAAATTYTAGTGISISTDNKINVIGTQTQLYQCPKGLTSSCAGDWVIEGCQGQISSSPTCHNQIWNCLNEDRICTPLTSNGIVVTPGAAATSSATSIKQSCRILKGTATGNNVDGVVLNCNNDEFAIGGACVGTVAPNTYYLDSVGRKFAYDNLVDSTSLPHGFGCGWSSGETYYATTLCCK